MGLRRRAAARLLLACLLVLAASAPRCGVAAAARRQLRQQGAGTTDPLSNVVKEESAARFYAQQGVTNGTLRVFRSHVAMRLAGARFIPFTVADQAVVMQLLRDTLLPRGPVAMQTFREYVPDPSEPPNIRDTEPGVEFSFFSYWAFNASQLAQEPSQDLWRGVTADVMEALDSLAMKLTLQGWGIPMPKLLFTAMDPGYFTDSGFTLAPLIVLNATLDLTVKPGPVSAEQATLVASTVGYLLNTTDAGTLVEVVGNNGELVSLEVTLYRCRPGASLPSPECEKAVLEAIINQLESEDVVRQQWQAAGVLALNVVSISQRNIQLPPPPPPPGMPWVPWHLDRIDQRSLPLDGMYTATALGTSGDVHVDIYIMSSGIYAEHDEFKYLDGTPGTRVEAGWGYQNLDPLADCPDYELVAGRGTLAASLCCGLTVGVAKNASIHSVRFRERCTLSGEEDLNAADALPAALDYVLAKAQPPALVLLDGWWFPGSFTDINPVLTRLDKFYERNILLVNGVGAGPFSACESPIAVHPSVFAVAGSDYYDQNLIFNPIKPGCVEIYSPSGGLGVGLTGASPAGPSNYTRTIEAAMGAAPIVAGVIIQYLQKNPTANIEDIHRAMMQQYPTLNKVTQTSFPNRLVFTNFTQPGSNPGGGGGSSSLSGGAIAGIAVGATVAVAAVALVAWGLVRRQWQPGTADLKSAHAGWEIERDEIEILKRPDGSDWLLGEGRYGRVYKAVKSGVQVVAVKKMIHVNEDMKARFLKEIDILRFVSRDANIVQYYGAYVGEDDILAVCEFMEGGDLRAALSSSHGPELQWNRRGKDVFLDVVRGLAFLHTNNVVHRDLKASNILLDRHSRAKVGDVGLARLFGPQQQGRNGAAGAAGGGFAGTMAYAAPEAFLGQPLTAKSDVYSMGVLLWELVTLEVPRRGALRAVLPQDCPQEVADAIDACMQQDSALRPTTRQLYATLLNCRQVPENGTLVSVTLSSRLAASGSLAISGAGSAGSGSGGGGLGNGGGGGQGNGGGGGQAAGALVSSFASGTSGKANGSEKSPPPTSLVSAASADLAVVNIPYDHLEFANNPDGQRVELGIGAFGKVYKVTIDGVQELAAKSLNLGHEAAVHASFLREASLLWRLRHSNIVALCGVSISPEGQGLLLMELMDGGSMFSMLNARLKASRERVFSWYNRGAQVLAEVAHGLHYLHSQKVVHFDIKSGNVLLTKGLNAKLADVGLSRVMSCTHHSLSLETNGPPGTFCYMAPELLSGRRCTSAVDIYSFGILLHEICTGRHPVRGHMPELRADVDCPKEVNQLFQDCLAQDPAQRPSAREVVQRLARARRKSADGRGPQQLSPSASGTPANGSSGDSRPCPATTAAVALQEQEYGGGTVVGTPTNGSVEGLGPGTAGAPGMGTAVPSSDTTVGVAFPMGSAEVPSPFLAMLPARQVGAGA